MTPAEALILLILGLLVFALFFLADAVSAVRDALNDHADILDTLNKER